MSVMNKFKVIEIGKVSYQAKLIIKSHVSKFINILVPLPENVSDHKINALTNLETLFPFLPNRLRIKPLEVKA